MSSLAQLARQALCGPSGRAAPAPAAVRAACRAVPTLPPRARCVTRAVAPESEQVSARAQAPAEDREAVEAYSGTNPSVSSLQLDSFSAGVTLSALLTLGLLLAPEHAMAGEELSGSAVEVFQEWLEKIEALGNLGPLLFVVTVSCAELIPLFPTQPLCLAGGLLFGPVLGAACVLTGCTIAATTAYSISKGVGRKLAERVIKSEMDESEEQGLVATKIAEVKNQIETGGPWQQFSAVTALRLTPVVPFSASNYVLGLTPVPLTPFIAGTVTGMTVWSTIYASLGGAGRTLMQRGVPLADVLGEIQEQVVEYTDIAFGVFALGVAGAVAYSVLKPAEEAVAKGSVDVATAESLESADVELEEVTVSAKSNSRR